MNLSMIFDAMPQRLTAENFVYIPSSITDVIQITVRFQLYNNALNCSHRDAYFYSQNSNY